MDNVCKEYSATSIQQLTKLITDTQSRELKEKNIYPISLVQSIFDGITGNRLDVILSLFNCIYIPYGDSKRSTRLKVPNQMRRLGLIITFKDATNAIYTQQYVGDSFDDANWGNDKNWEDCFVSFDSSEAVEQLKQYFTNYINNVIGDITGVKFVVVTSLPSVGEKGTIYLMKNNSSTEANNIYDEYIWLADKSSYEKLGSFSTSIDLSNYQLKLVSGENIKTINGESILGSGDIKITAGNAFPSDGVEGQYLKKSDTGVKWDDGDIVYINSTEFDSSPISQDIYDKLVNAITNNKLIGLCVNIDNNTFTRVYCICGMYYANTGDIILEMDFNLNEHNTITIHSDLSAEVDTVKPFNKVVHKELLSLFSFDISENTVTYSPDTVGSFNANNYLSIFKNNGIIVFKVLMTGDSTILYPYRSVDDSTDVPGGSISFIGILKYNDIFYDITVSIVGVYGDDIDKQLVIEAVPHFNIEDIPNASQSKDGLMSAEDKAKLDDVSNNANNYTHPTGSAASKSLGLYKISTDSTSHVQSVSAITKSDITGLGIPAQDTTYNNATSTASGLMSASDKEKLDSINVDNATINIVADAKALKGATMRFSGFVSGVTITQTETTEWDSIVYDTSINKFLAKKENIYYNVWSDMNAYMSDEVGTSILKDKLYIYDEDVYVWSDTEGTLVKLDKEILKEVNNILYKKRFIEFDVNLTPGIAVLPKDITLGKTFPFGANGSLGFILRGIFEVTEGEKVYFSTLPSLGSYFSGCAVLDKDYIVISLKPSSDESYFEVPAGGKYVVFQALTDSGYPTIYVESLESTTEEIDTTDLELLQNPTIDCLATKAAYMFGDIGTKVTNGASWRGVSTTCYSCVPGDVFYITSLLYWNLDDYTGAFAVVSENNVILAKDTKPLGFWHYMTKVVVPEGGAKLLVNNTFGTLRVYKKKVTRDIYPEKESLVAAASLVTVGANYSDRRLNLSWASDTHADSNLYKRWIDWTNSHIGMFDAALHTGDFNRMADADNGFVVTALKYRTTIPFLPTLGNHDCFGQTVGTNTLNSGSLEWNGNKYIKPFVGGDSACVVGNDGCYYYRDFIDKKIRMIVINDYDKPRWADGTYWITTTDEAEIANAVEWTYDTSYAVGDVVHYKGMYVKCKTAGKLDDNAHVWRPDLAVLSKTPVSCRYINQAQADFIVNAMNVDSDWGIIFVTHQPYEALPAIEQCISKWTLRRDLVNTYVGVPFGQNGYMIQDLITAYLNRTTLNRTYECITPNVDPLASNVVKTNLPDFYPDVTIDADFTNAVGDVICCLNGHQHSDTAYWSQHTGENKVLCIGAPLDCYLPFDAWSNPWPAGDIAKNGGAKDCFNVISIDTTEKAVYLVRIGADKTDQFENRDCIRISYAHNQ